MKKTKLDAADIRILSAIQKHGPLSKAKLAELVNLSPTPCWMRLDRMKKAGLIRGYHADISLDAVVGLSQVVVTVSLKSHRKFDFERFESRIMASNEIINCVSTGGGMDYVMTVVSPSLQEFQSLMDQLLCEEIGIEKYMTYIVTRTIKSTQPDLKRMIQT